MRVRTCVCVHASVYVCACVGVHLLLSAVWPACGSSCTVFFSSTFSFGCTPLSVCVSCVGVSLVYACRYMRVGICV